MTAVMVQLIMLHSTLICERRIEASDQEQPRAAEVLTVTELIDIASNESFDCSSMRSCSNSAASAFNPYKTTLQDGSTRRERRVSSSRVSTTLQNNCSPPISPSLMPSLECRSSWSIAINAPKLFGSESRRPILLPQVITSFQSATRARSQARGKTYYMPYSTKFVPPPNEAFKLVIAAWWFS